MPSAEICKAARMRVQSARLSWNASREIVSLRQSPRPLLKSPGTGSSERHPPSRYSNSAANGSRNGYVAARATSTSLNVARTVPASRAHPPPTPPRTTISDQTSSGQLAARPVRAVPLRTPWSAEMAPPLPRRHLIDVERSADGPAAWTTVEHHFRPRHVFVLPRRIPFRHAPRLRGRSPPRPGRR